MTTYDPDNIFAKILRGELPCHKLFEDEHNFAFMDIMPRGPGHCLVIPKAPVRNILDAGDDVLSRLYPAIAKVARAAKSAFQADGVTIQQFNEAAGGQVVFHMHVHIIPRFEGVSMGPPASQMEKPDVLAANADRIRAALAEV
ncbi:MAG: HIT family protein [Pseudomonadota bacterium]|nr:HIT family protein [Pseudomonadota bacterium]